MLCSKSMDVRIIMLYYTYILKLSNGSHYTGITNNMYRRLREHEKGKSISTRRFLPAILIYHYISYTRTDSRRLEVHIKNMGAKRYLNWLKFSCPRDT